MWRVANCPHVIMRVRWRHAGGVTPSTGPARFRSPGSCTRRTSRHGSRRCHRTPGRKVRRPSPSSPGSSTPRAPAVCWFGSEVTLWKRSYRLAGWQAWHWQSLPRFGFRQRSHTPRWSSRRRLDTSPHRAHAGAGGWESVGLVRDDPPFTASPFRRGPARPTGTLAEGLRRRPGPPDKRRRRPFPRLGTSVRRTWGVPKPPIGRFAGTKWTSLICPARLRNVAGQVHGVRAIGA
jgi:hypothetical protein